MSRGSKQHVIDSSVAPADWQLQSQLSSGDRSLHKSTEQKDALFLEHLCKGMDSEAPSARSVLVCPASLAVLSFTPRDSHKFFEPFSPSMIRNT